MKISHNQSHGVAMIESDDESDSGNGLRVKTTTLSIETRFGANQVSGGM